VTKRDGSLKPAFAIGIPTGTRSASALKPARSPRRRIASNMGLDDFAHKLRSALADADIPYMVVGSLASSFHGEPRTTRDVDIVIDPTPRALSGLVADVQAAGCYASADAAQEALIQRSQFNVVDPETGWKADLIILGRRPFSRSEFERRLPADLPGQLAFVATAEDTIISKLDWAREGESERQLRDVASIIAVSGDALDRAYLERWIRELGLQDLWAQAGGV
jgi:hypothetical protein